MACSAPSVASSAVGSRIALAGGGHILDQEFLLRWSRLSWPSRRTRQTRSPSAFLPTPWPVEWLTPPFPRSSCSPSAAAPLLQNTRHFLPSGIFPLFT